MSDSGATLIAATIAAVVAGLGLVWSIVAYFLTRRSSARAEWRSRFDQALDLVRSAEDRDQRAGIILIQKLSTERWITDEDRATAALVMVDWVS